MDQVSIVLLLDDENHTRNIVTLIKVFKQTYNDIQLIICDDCSNSFDAERTIKNIRVYRKANFQQIILLENERPLGITKTYERALQYCTGKYVIFIRTGDLFVDKGVVARIVSYFEKKDENLGMIVTNTKLYSSDMRKYLKNNLSPRDIYAIKSNNLNYLLKTLANKFFLYSSGIVYKKAYLNNLFPIESKYAFARSILIKSILAGNPVCYAYFTSLKCADEECQCMDSFLHYTRYLNGLREIVEKLNSMHGITDENRAILTSMVEIAKLKLVQLSSTLPEKSKALFRPRKKQTLKIKLKEIKELPLYKHIKQWAFNISRAKKITLFLHTSLIFILLNQVIKLHALIIAAVTLIVISMLLLLVNFTFRMRAYLRKRGYLN